MTGLRKSPTSVLTILALTGCLSGCAILTVDVDVYKGSLINEEHVQLHQLRTLAIAAQPLLVQLRDNLEWPDSDGLPPKGAIPKCKESPTKCVEQANLLEKCNQLPWVCPKEDSSLCDNT